MTDAEEKEKVVMDAVRILGEHFDAVQVLVSWNDNGTSIVSMGSGNWYARQGMAHEFIQKDIAQENATQIANKIREDDELGGS